MAEGDVCKCVLRNPSDGPDRDCWIHGESRAELYERARAAGYAEAKEQVAQACRLFAIGARAGNSEVGRIRAHAADQLAVEFVALTPAATTEAK